MMMWHQIKAQLLASSNCFGSREFRSTPTGGASQLLVAGQGNPRLLLAIAVIGVAWIIYRYRDTALAMEAIWSRSGTFAHGYLVVPISLWLVWRHLALVASIRLQPSMFGVFAGFLCGFTWLVAQLASVDAVAQFSLVGIVISTVWSVLGTEFVRALAFPLAFLFFCVPFGEFLFPSMMDMTTEFVVRALRLTGVPVFVEGRSLIIPSGHWEVVEGCSGVRYLIASVVVGSLYGYLNYRSIWRRVVFTVLAVVCPVAANWLRAYGIVLLGHVSGNRLATGVDHLVYGWVFFGIVMLALFWIGSRWQEDSAAWVEKLDGVQTLKAEPASRWKTWLSCVTAIALLSLWPLLEYRLLVRGNQGKIDLTVPAPGNGWSLESGGAFDFWAPRYSGMSASGQSVWEKQGKKVGLFIGYYRDQMPGQELINSENRVLKNKDPDWKYLSSGSLRVNSGLDTITVQNIRISGNPGRLQVAQLYWIGGRLTSDDYMGKAFLALNRLLGRGDDSAVVMVYTWEGAEGRDSAGVVLGDFFRDMGPAISAALKASSER